MKSFSVCRIYFSMEVVMYVCNIWDGWWRRMNSGRSEGKGEKERQEEMRRFLFRFYWRWCESVHDLCWQQGYRRTENTILPPTCTSTIQYCTSECHHTMTYESVCVCEPCSHIYRTYISRHFGNAAVVWRTVFTTTGYFLSSETEEGNKKSTLRKLNFCGCEWVRSSMIDAAMT